MIRNKKDLKYYLEEDRRAYYKKKEKGFKAFVRNRIFKDRFYEYMIVLRKLEYAINCGRGIKKYYYAYKLSKLKEKTGIDLDPNVAGPGLHISHGKCLINPNARLGAYCKINSDVTIGATGTYKVDGRSAPIIGDRVYIGSGARVLGGITIANGVVIGANAVVIKDVLEEDVTVAGIPAKIISKKGSSDYLAVFAKNEE